ncbi:MAG: tripartite tricarboxylate transporter permease [Candidatus Nanoarchaeia archaeon]|nr:tripartite tricarboxylate transporter permease [Candidatus Nanoarchaeia archaeon]MDD5358061.1 tripartite tricarboxylate transporter permease [Candidatus Nanoarchaeia archaeon]MDD5589249.1 tripartite tricarboxylate transporter permease [Candidatus Nanoarchaeia archaeon]
MLFEILISIFIGVLAGTVTGLIPGVHINLVGAILVSLSVTIFSGIDSLYLIIFISSMAIAHTFVDFIPSIFLGCPDTDTQLSVLPGHELLKEGKGYEAVMLTAVGGIFAVFILIIISFPLSLIVSEIYNSVHSVMFWILLATSLLLLFTESKKFTALFVFVISGIFGLCALNIDVKEPLLPLLTGLFGSSMLVTSIKNKIEIPKQEITKPECRLFKPLLGSLIASPLCGFLPGLGGGQAVVLGNTISRTDKKGFLVLVGATNILVMGLSFVSLYAISKTRTGAAAAIQEIIGILSWKCLLVILIAVLFSGIISFFLTKILTKFFAQKISKINYSVLSIATLIFLTIIVFIFSGFLGLLVLTASTLVGIYCNSLAVKKTHMMGCLLIPTMIYYFPKFF